MAIVQASLAEEILSRQERSVVRGIYRASQLHQALVELMKIEEGIKVTGIATPGKPQIDSKSQILLLKNYLVECISVALVSTKTPQASVLKNSTKQEPAQ